MKHDVSWAFVAWMSYSRRSEVFAKALGGELYCIQYLSRRSRYQAPIRYTLQGLHTLWVLFRERPQAVHVQNPPFVCSWVVLLYCRVAGARFVIDHHSATFTDDWGWALPAQKWVARRAVTNIVTNQHWADIVHSWGAHALIMGDPFLSLPPGSTFPVSQRFNVAFVCTFSTDEPLEAVLEAAAQLPDVQFYVTGDTRHKPQSFYADLPKNVRFTGFLPDQEYVALLRAVDAILVLTTRDHTLQLGGCEAVSIQQPLITSDWPFLREFFAKGTVYVDNTPAGIRTGIQAMQKETPRLKAEMVAFRDAARPQWEAQLRELKEMVERDIGR
jgi:glycosyltransferase involved in cell wall biosynthesis